MSADAIVLVAYLGIVLGCGIYFAGRSTNTDDFTVAGRSLPGWAIGLSMFGSYISSISFLANPGKAFASNWSALVFAFAAPIAALIAVRWFVRFYRATGEVSAYEHLEHRFGLWARMYATVCFLLMQVARMGTIVYLLALAIAPLTGWSIPVTAVTTTTVMTTFTLLGGIKAVVWVGVLQSVVLTAGAAAALAAVMLKTPGGISEIFKAAAAQHKFSLGVFDSTASQASFWSLFAFGLFTHLGNFGTDQSYVQRYITAVSDREAEKSIWIAALLYVPVAATFFFIGTSLFVFYASFPGLLPTGLKPDAVFPLFINTQLPPAVGGLVVAAIVAASMDSNLNSMATLTLRDIYQRYLRPSAGEQESMWVLRISTLGWGVAGGAVSLAMMNVATVLDAWYQVSSVLSGGVLGLFLLGLLSRRADSVAALWAVGAGLVVLTLVGIPQLFAATFHFDCPFDPNLSIVFGTLTILIVGLLFAGCRQMLAVASVKETNRDQ